jgi:hypothetical protein
MSRDVIGNPSLDKLRTATDQGDVCLAGEAINGVLRSMALMSLLDDESLSLVVFRLNEIAGVSDEHERRLLMNFMDYVEAMKRG